MSVLVLVGSEGDLARSKLQPLVARAAAGGHTVFCVDLAPAARVQARWGTRAIGTYVDVSAGTDALAEALSGVAGEPPIVVYVATSPTRYPKVLAAYAAFLPPHRSTFALEKPLATSREALAALREEVRGLQNLGFQVVAIDHYVQKWCVRVAAASVADSVIGRLRSAATSVTVAARETIDVSERQDFYRGVGALRDMGVHLGAVVLHLTGSLPEADARVRTWRARYRASGLGAEDETFFRVEFEEPGRSVMLASGKGLPTELKVARLSGPHAEMVGDLGKNQLDLHVGETSLRLRGPGVRDDAYERVLGSLLAGEPAPLGFEQVVAVNQWLMEIAEGIRALPIREYERGEDPDMLWAGS